MAEGGGEDLLHFFVQVEAHLRGEVDHVARDGDLGCGEQRGRGVGDRPAQFGKELRRFVAGVGFHLIVKVVLPGDLRHGGVDPGGHLRRALLKREFRSHRFDAADESFRQGGVGMDGVGDAAALVDDAVNAFGLDVHGRSLSVRWPGGPGGGYWGLFSAYSSMTRPHISLYLRRMNSTSCWECLS